MKARGLLTLLLLFAAPLLFGQEQTLLSGKVEHGGFGGPVVKFTQFNGDFGVMPGGRGAWVINHAFTVGGGGYGLANDLLISGNGNPDSARYLNFGYGGAEIGYIVSSRDLVHLEFNTLIGAGGVSSRRNTLHTDFEVDENGDAFFVLEPSLHAELNVTTFFRIAAGVSYRYIGGAKYESIDDNDLRGLSAILTFKFGSF